MAAQSGPKPQLIEWLRDYNESGWRRYIHERTARGEMVTVAGVLVDARALFETRFRCDSRTCAMPGREAGVESCCMEYDVEITPAEHQRILDHAPEAIEFLHRAEPERVAADRPIASFFDERHVISLNKEQGRCAFSFRDRDDRLWCGLHSMALERGMALEAVKPMACILFPLVVCRLDNGDTLLTATSAETERLFDGPKESELLPCLRHQVGGFMFEEMRSAIEMAFGPEFYTSLGRVAQEYAARRRS